MKRIKTKLLSVVLSAVMALALPPMGVFAGAKPHRTKDFTNPIIEKAIEEINDTIAEKGGYASLSLLEETDEGGEIRVTIIKGDYPLEGTGAYLDIFGTMVKSLYDDYKKKTGSEWRILQVIPESGDNPAPTSAWWIDFFGHESRLSDISYSYFRQFAERLCYSYKNRIDELEGRTLTFRARGNHDTNNPLNDTAVYRVLFVAHPVLTKHEKIPATCTKDGEIAYYQCDLCGKKFKDKDAQQPITDEEIKTKAAHKLGMSDAMPASCTKAGVKAYYECSVCGRKFADKEAKQEIANIVVPAEGHKLSLHEAKAATCTEEGLAAYYECSVCGKKYTDKDAMQEVTSITVAAVGHRWGDWQEETGYMVRTCSVCGAKLQGAVVAKVPKKVPLRIGQTTTKIQIPLAPGDSIVSVKSSDKKIATVKVLKNGRLKVNAKKKTGTVKIKVKLASGKTVKFKVRVKSKVFTTKVTVPKKLRFHAGEKYTLNVKLTPITTSQGVSYRSSNPKVAKVSKKGVVTALKKGTATITVTSGSKKAVCKVKVK